MSVLLQLPLLFLAVILQYGPLARLAQWHYLAPDLLLLSVWLFAWLGDMETSLTWSILLGVAVGLLNFQRFGFWLALYCLAAVLVQYVKRRFFQVSSTLEAMLTLIALNIIFLATASLLAGEFNWVQWLVNLAVDVIIGFLALEFIIRRFRLIQRWTGGRI